MSSPSPAATKTKNGNGPPAPQSALSVAERGVLPGDSLGLSWVGFSDKRRGIIGSRGSDIVAVRWRDGRGGVGGDEHGLQGKRVQEEEGVGTGGDGFFRCVCISGKAVI